MENSEGVLIFGDTIQEKAWTDENELMCCHFDQVSGRNVRGIFSMRCTAAIEHLFQ